jgi:hypothetical protein
LGDHPAFGNKVTEQLSGLWPEGTEPLFAALANQSNVKGFEQLEIADSQIDDLLDPRAGVEHGGEQRVIALALDGTAIDRSEHCQDLLVLQVLNRPRAGALEWNGEDSLTLLQAIGTSPCKKGEEGVDGCEADVPRGRAVTADVLQMLEKGHDLLGIEVVDVQLNDGAGAAGGHETQEEYQAVPITVDRVGTHPPQTRKVVG